MRSTILNDEKTGEAVSNRDETADAKQGKITSAVDEIIKIIIFKIKTLNK